MREANAQLVFCILYEHGSHYIIMRVNFPFKIHVRILPVHPSWEHWVYDLAYRIHFLIPYLGAIPAAIRSFIQSHCIESEIFSFYIFCSKKFANTLHCATFSFSCDFYSHNVRASCVRAIHFLRMWDLFLLTSDFTFT